MRCVCGGGGGGTLNLISERKISSTEVFVLGNVFYCAACYKSVVE